VKKLWRRDAVAVAGGPTSSRVAWAALFQILFPMLQALFAVGESAVLGIIA
jgi:hypothetical protein